MVTWSPAARRPAGLALRWLASRIDRHHDLEHREVRVAVPLSFDKTPSAEADELLIDFIVCGFSTAAGLTAASMWWDRATRSPCSLAHLTTAHSGLSARAGLLARNCCRAEPGSPADPGRCASRLRYSFDRHAPSRSKRGSARAGPSRVYGRSAEGRPLRGAENRDAALSIGIGAAAGGLVGLVVGTFKGGEAATHAVHDDIAEAFQRCMKERGYTVMRERRAH